MAKAVLIVDDNAFIRQALCDIFKREADFEVCGEAENGREAIEKGQQLHPDLIVMDLSMPVMNGLDAARVLKRLMPAVPLIVFSEYSDVFSEKEARSVYPRSSQSLSTCLFWSAKLALCSITLPRDSYFFSQSGNPRLSRLRTRRLAKASSMACRSAV